MMGKLRSSVDARMRLALDLLQPHAEGKTLLDLGCGGGRVAVETVKTLGAAKAHGIDISPAAIEKANALASRADVGERVTFEVGTVERDAFPTADITLGLGLLDWLNDEETERLLTALKGRRIVLSYSEQDGSLAEIIHRFYLVYPLRWFGGAVSARHHPRGQIAAWMEKHGFTPFTIVDDKAARFGKLVHNLDTPT
jgi:ubiquinone/menaquinone biosynthesis C-methylase UbiE